MHVYTWYITIIPIPFASVFQDVECGWVHYFSLFHVQFLMQLYLLPFIQPDSDSVHNQEPITASIHKPQQLITSQQPLNQLEQYILAINRLERKGSWTVVNITYIKQVWLFCTCHFIPVACHSIFFALYTQTNACNFYRTKSDLNVLGRWDNLNSTSTRRSPY